MNNEEKILTMLESMNGRMDNLESEVGELKSDMGSLRHSVMVIENEHGHALKALLAGMAGIQERFDRQDRIEQRIENHDERIFALEQVVSR